MTTTPDTAPLGQEETIASLGHYGYGWSDTDIAGATAKRGLSEAVVRDISAKKSEPEWMLETRLRALRTFDKKPMPNWGSDLRGIDFDNIKYFVRSTEKQATSWEELPEDIKRTYDRLGIPEAEKQRLVSGVAAQYECLAGETLVWTANRGQVPIKEIAHGDRVFAYDEDLERFVVAPVKSAAQTDTRLTHTVTTTRRSLRATATIRCSFSETNGGLGVSAHASLGAGCRSARSGLATSSPFPAGFRSSVAQWNFPRRRACRLPPTALSI